MVELGRDRGVQLEDTLEKDFGFVIEQLRGNEDLHQIILHRLITPNEKFGLVKAVFGGRVSPVLIDFLRLVFEKRRERWLEEIYRQYVLYLDSIRNIAEAELVVAAGVDDVSLDELARRLQALTGMKVKLSVKEDPSLIAGAVLRLGDKVYDGSVRGRLTSLMGQMARRGTAGK